MNIQVNYSIDPLRFFSFLYITNNKSREKSTKLNTVNGTEKLFIIEIKRLHNLTNPRI